jgi:hypothetical protein
VGFNKRYIDKNRIAKSFSRRGILGVRELLGLEGLGKIDAIITQDEFSGKVVTAYQEGRENDVSFDIMDEVLKILNTKDVPKPLNDFERYCLNSGVDPYLQTK